MEHIFRPCASRSAACGHYLASRSVPRKEPSKVIRAWEEEAMGPGVPLGTTTHGHYRDVMYILKTMVGSFTRLFSIIGVTVLVSGKGGVLGEETPTSPSRFSSAQVATFGTLYNWTREMNDALKSAGIDVAYFSSLETDEDSAAPDYTITGNAAIRPGWGSIFSSKTIPDVYLLFDLSQAIKSLPKGCENVPCPQLIIYADGYCSFGDPKLASHCIDVQRTGGRSFAGQKAIVLTIAVKLSPLKKAGAWFLWLALILFIGGAAAGGFMYWKRRVSGDDEGKRDESPQGHGLDN